MLGILYLSIFLFGGMMFLALCGMAAERYCEAHGEEWDDDIEEMEQPTYPHKKAC